VLGGDVCLSVSAMVVVVVVAWRVVVVE